MATKTIKVTKGCEPAGKTSRRKRGTSDSIIIIDVEE